MIYSPFSLDVQMFINNRSIQGAEQPNYNSIRQLKDCPPSPGLPQTADKFAMIKLLQIEIKLMIKGRPSWWYGITAALFIFSIFSSPEINRYFLPILWLWPISLFSPLGAVGIHIRICHRRWNDSAYPDHRNWLFFSCGIGRALVQSLSLDYPTGSGEFAQRRDSFS